MTDRASDDRPQPEHGPQSALASGLGKPDPAGGTRYRRHRFVRIAAWTAAAAVVAAAGAGWFFYERLDNNIRTDAATERALAEAPQGRPGSASDSGRGGERAQNILLLGSDKEAGMGTQRADTTMLLHLSADRTRAALMSVPRDLLVDIPSCRTPDGGGHIRAQRAKFNAAFELGGPACTIRTFENLSGIRIDHHVVIDFSGFRRMVDAVGGVDVRVDVPVYDPETGIRLKPGQQRLNGVQALVYVRTRLGVGDGSDTQRMGRQQHFMHALMDKVVEGGTLKSPGRIYPLLRAVTSSLTADSGLDSIKELYTLIGGGDAVNSSNTRFIILPRRPADANQEYDELVQPDANQVFEGLRKDRDVNF
ncbi:LCP family protein [Streptomyces sp. NPDC057136]|uniref:LCP family protein n=1 Tax=Streptomyces sp. NPDC057136 TaxID=3346029 RepID=UPI00362D7AE6